jgi:thiol-disulfide isomerase/thioredoxin
MRASWKVVPAFAVLGLAAVSAAAALAAPDSVEYKFKKPPIHAQGAQGMADFLGKPVIIDFWGTRCPPCVGTAVPASIKMQRELGDDVQVIFAESQGANLEKVEAFAWRQKWFGTNAIWTNEHPTQVEGNTLPKFALLGIDGKVLLTGNPIEKEKQIEELVAAEIKKAKEPPAGTPAKLHDAWKSFVKGSIGAAIAECDKLAAGAGADAALAESAKSLRALMVERTNVRVTRAKWLLDNGFVDEGNDKLAALGKAVKGCKDFDEAIAEQMTRVLLPDEAFKREMEAAKALAAIETKMRKDKPFDDANVKALAKLGEKFAGTKSGERAAHLSSLAAVKLD